MTDYTFYGYFIASKVGKTGLTVTVDVYGPGGVEASDQSATEIGGGLYSYTHTDATPGDYLALFKTTDITVDYQQIPDLIPRMNDISAAEVNAEVVDVLRTDTLPDSYAANGAQPTIAQAILAIQQFLFDKAVSSTTVTVKKPDGTTQAMTFTLDSATSPTTITRAS